jgi:hypothetical protein
LEGAVVLHGLVEIGGDGAGLAVEVNRVVLGPLVGVDEDDEGEDIR